MKAGAVSRSASPQRSLSAQRFFIFSAIFAMKSYVFFQLKWPLFRPAAGLTRIKRTDDQLDKSNLNRDKFIGRGTAVCIILLLIFSRTGFSAADNDKKVPAISVHQVKMLLNNSDVIIIDVRKYRNWWRSSKKILSAVREDPYRVHQWAQKYPKDKTLIFY
jgi:hypothetical protein